MSKTFKSAYAEHGDQKLNIIGVDDGVRVSVDHGSHGAKGIIIAPSDAPALALAILEAAGFKAEFHATGTFQDGDCWQLENVAQVIKDYLSIKDAEAAEAEARAKLEAEALKLLLAFQTIDDPDNRGCEWRQYGTNTKDKWLAVARRAREMRAEK